MLFITSYMSLQVRGRETQYIIPNKVSTSWSMRPWGGFGRSFKFQCFLSCSHKEWMVHSYGKGFWYLPSSVFNQPCLFFVSPTFLVNKKSPAYLHTDFNQFHPWNPWKCRSNMVRFLGCRFSPRASMKSALSPRIRHHWIHQHWLWWKGSKGPHGSPVRKDPKKLKSERPWNSGEHHEIKHSTSFSINLPWR